MFENLTNIYFNFSETYASLGRLGNRWRGLSRWFRLWSSNEGSLGSLGIGQQGHGGFKHRLGLHVVQLAPTATCGDVSGYLRNSRHKIYIEQLKKHRFWILTIRYQFYVLPCSLKLRSGLTLRRPLFKPCSDSDGGFSPLSAFAALAADLIYVRKTKFQLAVPHVERAFRATKMSTPHTIWAILKVIGFPVWGKSGVQLFDKLSPKYKP